MKKTLKSILTALSLAAAPVSAEAQYDKAMLRADNFQPTQTQVQPAANCGPSTYTPTARTSSTPRRNIHTPIVQTMPVYENGAARGNLRESGAVCIDTLPGRLEIVLPRNHGVALSKKFMQDAAKAGYDTLKLKPTTEPFNEKGVTLQRRVYDPNALYNAQKMQGTVGQPIPFDMYVTSGNCNPCKPLASARGTVRIITKPQAPATVAQQAQTAPSAPSAAYAGVGPFVRFEHSSLQPNAQYDAQMNGPHRSAPTTTTSMAYGIAGEFAKKLDKGFVRAHGEYARMQGNHEVNGERIPISGHDGRVGVDAIIAMGSKGGIHLSGEVQPNMTDGVYESATAKQTNFRAQAGGAYFTRVGTLVAGAKMLANGSRSPTNGSQAGLYAGLERSVLNDSTGNKFDVAAEIAYTQGAIVNGMRSSTLAPQFRMQYNHGHLIVGGAASYRMNGGPIQGNLVQVEAGGKLRF